MFIYGSDIIHKLSTPFPFLSLNIGGDQIGKINEKNDYLYIII